MRDNTTFVTQSKFFSPAFNAAIFDGPVRIYFAQYQESLALKVYFNLQERFQDLRKDVRGEFREQGRCIFVMLYPTDETFDMCFDGNSGSEQCVVLERMGTDFVLGLKGAIDETQIQKLSNHIEEILNQVRTARAAVVSPDATI